jgi:hypothetical protein
MATKDEKKREEKRLHPVNIRLDHATLEKLRELAASDGRPVANYVANLIRLHIAEKTAGIPLASTEGNRGRGKSASKP